MPNSKRKAQAGAFAADMDSYQVRTLQKKRTTNFREDETKLLISLWGSPAIQNKLYLTHRKAPVMRLLAANMQQRGFYRSPDEIKTRIRNLKCLYHRIKRTMVTGSGIGTVDPDWPHFKAMDAILGKENAKGAPGAAPPPAADRKDDGELEGPRCEDIKQELDLDINDDMESWPGNESLAGSDFDEQNMAPTPPAKVMCGVEPASAPPAIQPMPAAPLPAVLPNITIPTPQTSMAPLRPAGPMSSTIPLPLLILNHGIQPQPQLHEKKTDSPGKTPTNVAPDHAANPTDVSNILREMLAVQKQQLELEKQRLELEKQRLEFDRVVGTQLMTLVPMVGGLLQRLVYPAVAQHSAPLSESASENNEADPKSSQDKPMSDYDILKDSKILRSVLERGIKKYMMSDEQHGAKDLDHDNDDDSENDDSGINESNLLIDHDHSSSDSK